MLKEWAVGKTTATTTKKGRKLPRLENTGLTRIYG